jgi:ribosomal protein L39E
MSVIIVVWLIALWIHILVREANVLQAKLRQHRHALNAKRLSASHLENNRNVPVWVHVRIAKIERKYEKRQKMIRSNQWKS